MKALMVSSDLEDLLNDKEINGKVHSVFKNVMNIKTGNNLIGILSKNVSMSPESIKLTELINFQNLKIEKDMKVIINKNELKIVESKIIINLDNHDYWNVSPYFEYEKAKLDDVIKKIKYLENYIYLKGDVDGLAPVIFSIGNSIPKLKSYKNLKVKNDNKYIKFIFKRLVDFIEAIQNNDENLNEYSSKIIGFGPGLTPAMDDFISGLMISLIYVSEYFNYNLDEIYNINNKIINNIDNKTTELSSQMLVNSASGKANEVIRKLIVSILSDENIGELDRCIYDVNSIGQTSGSDILSGIYIGSRLVINKGEV